jgi:hypothetical protein
VRNEAFTAQVLQSRCSFLDAPAAADLDALVG